MFSNPYEVRKHYIWSLHTVEQIWEERVFGFKKNKHLKSIWPSQITVNIGHLSMKLLVICGAFSMLINVNIPTHLILDESDMYVSNPDITTWLQSQASLSSHVYTLNACMWNNHSSGCRGRPKCCFNQSLIRIPTHPPRSSFSWSIIAVIAK